MSLWGTNSHRNYDHFWQKGLLLVCNVSLYDKHNERGNNYKPEV